MFKSIKYFSCETYACINCCKPGFSKVKCICHACRIITQVQYTLIVYKTASILVTFATRQRIQLSGIGTPLAIWADTGPVNCNCSIFIY